MIPSDDLLVFAAASAALAIAPGPDNIFVLTQSALHGRWAGILVTCGLCTGLLLHITAVVLGVAAILKTSAIAFAVLKILGAAYLLYLAWQALQVRRIASPLPAELPMSNSTLERSTLVESPLAESPQEKSTVASSILEKSPVEESPVATPPVATPTVAKSPEASPTSEDVTAAEPNTSTHCAARDLASSHSPMSTAPMSTAPMSTAPMSTATDAASVPVTEVPALLTGVTCSDITEHSASTPATGVPAPRAGALCARGIVMNATNPKVAIFFMAFLPQFADPGRGSTSVQIVVLGLIFMVTTGVIFSLIAWTAGHLGAWLQRSERAQTNLHRVAATVFTLLAIRLLLTPHPVPGIS